MQFHLTYVTRPENPEIKYMEIMPLFIYKILIKKRYYIGKYVILKQYIRDAQMSAYVDQNHAPSLTDVQLKLKQKGETDEASG